jgi:preprotein translocase subunit YajC
MIEFPAAILLQAEPPGSPLGGFLVPMMLIFLIFYFLLIRPQQKRQKKQDAMIKGVEKGDSVVTAGGLHGKVTGVTDDVLTLDVGSVKSDRMRVKVSRARVEQVQKSNKGEDS